MCSGALSLIKGFEVRVDSPGYCSVLMGRVYSSGRHLEPRAPGP